MFLRKWYPSPFINRIGTNLSNFYLKIAMRKEIYTPFPVHSRKSVLCYADFPRRSANTGWDHPRSDQIRAKPAPCNKQSSYYRAFFRSCWRSVPHVAPQHITVREAQLPARFFAGHCLSACTYGSPGSLDHLPIRSALAYYATHHLGRSKNPRE